MTIKLIQLNIECDKHFERIFPFLEEEQPDVLCVQDISEHDVQHFAIHLGMHEIFGAMKSRSADGESYIQGFAVFTKKPMQKKWIEYYAGDPTHLPEYDGTTPDSKRSTQNFGVAFAEIFEDEKLYRIGTTHFPWTTGGEASDFQREDMHKLISLLEETGELVLTGDFNAPRGGEIFGMLAAKLKDNVPEEYTSSIDGSLHRAGPLPYMVDGIFSTQGYLVSDVSMRSGLSDHCALVATVDKI